MLLKIHKEGMHLSTGLRYLLKLRRLCLVRL